jgi:pimeloyl-ACP methyl ester carboxylesterase
VVIFEAGLGCSALDWLRVQRQVGLVTTTYSYDRAGEGSSDAVDSWSVHGWVADLEAWLAALHLTGPYVLVGHSLGGHVVRVFAARRPELVGGMVLVDAQPERLYDGWTPERMQYVRSINPPGIVDRILDGGELVKAVAGPLGCPVVVVTHGVIDLIRVEPGVSAEDVADFERCWQEGQRALALQSPQSRLVVATSSGHLIPMQQPELVAAEVLAMVHHVRG